MMFFFSSYISLRVLNPSFAHTSHFAIFFFFCLYSFILYIFLREYQQTCSYFSYVSITKLSYQMLRNCSLPYFLLDEKKVREKYVDVRLRMIQKEWKWIHDELRDSKYNLDLMLIQKKKNAKFICVLRINLKVKIWKNTRKSFTVNLTFHRFFFFQYYFYHVIYYISIFFQGWLFIIILQ